MEFTNFETERLIIQPTSIDDAVFIFQLMNSPKWIQYIGDRNINTIEDAMFYIKNKMIPQLKKLGFSNYTVIRKEDYQKIGTCGLFDREGLKGIDIGFAFLPDFEGKGYAFEASNRIKVAAFNDFKLDSLLAITAQDNKNSQKLLRKLEFQLIDTLTLPNDEEELFLFQLEK